MKTTLEQPSTKSGQRPPPVEYIGPDVNIFETEAGYVLEADLPGVSKDGLEITLEGNEIILVGHRADEVVSGELLFRERVKADFRRVFELDPAVATDKISAKMDRGVLTLTLPKSDRVRPRRIAVSD
jgi:HSP20 family protein